MDVPAFPATEADLAEWEVYADHLLTNGDPRGELPAHELALPAMPRGQSIRRSARAVAADPHARPLRRAAVRAQIVRALPEDHGLGPDGDGYLRASPGGSDLVRRGTRWTIRPRQDLILRQHGAPLAAIKELHDGDEISIEHVTLGDSPRVDCRFLTRDLDRA